ncbi:MAG: hypothetical protein HXY43_21455 [Fischerella sp.]|uniref:hypothetical protein n=1 Tax=Fischerella sp. TaxID=1191 RepID=UPI0018539548|nr:hypothetical protein [Fischerella sp.]NWF61750.1 hypothetical protein [Fischerella sp.]
METKHNYFIIFDTSEGAYLCLNPDNKGLLTYSTPKQACDAFELGYKERHQQHSSTWSTSATLHWLNLKPFVVALSASLTPMEVLKALSNSDTPDLKVYSLSSVAVSHVKGAKVDLETCRHYEVSKVELINPKWWQEEPA